MKHGGRFAYGLLGSALVAAVACAQPKEVWIELSATEVVRNPDGAWVLRFQGGSALPEGAVIRADILRATRGGSPEQGSVLASHNFVVGPGGGFSAEVAPAGATSAGARLTPGAYVLHLSVPEGLQRRAVLDRIPPGILSCPYLLRIVAGGLDQRVEAIREDLRAVSRGVARFHGAYAAYAAELERSRATFQGNGVPPASAEALPAWNAMRVRYLDPLDPVMSWANEGGRPVPFPATCASVAMACIELRNRELDDRAILAGTPQHLFKPLEEVPGSPAAVLAPLLREMLAWLLPLAGELADEIEAGGEQASVARAARLAAVWGGFLEPLRIADLPVSEEDAALRNAYERYLAARAERFLAAGATFDVDFGPSRLVAGVPAKEIDSLALEALSEFRDLSARFIQGAAPE